MGNANEENRLTYDMTLEGLSQWNKRLTLPANDEIPTEILENEDDSIVTGDFAMNKRVELVHKNYYRPCTVERMTDYVRSCDNRQHNKSNGHKKFGLLQVLDTL